MKTKWGFEGYSRLYTLTEVAGSADFSPHAQKLNKKSLI